MTTKRTIRGQQYSVEQIVDEAMATPATSPHDMENAERRLRSYGHTNPSVELMASVAREMAMLRKLGYITKANFEGQLGKISFSSRERTIADVQSYLNRRNQGQRSRWSASH